MAKFYFIVPSIIALLPALSEGALCPNGKLEQAQINTNVLDPVNKARQNLVAGTQKNGDSGKNLPAPKGMTALAWSCDLEKDAIDISSAHCPDYYDEPTDPQGRASVYFGEYQFDPVDVTAIKKFIDGELALINNVPLNAGSTAVYYNDDRLRNYVNLTRPTAVEIGCALTTCSSQNAFIIYCILNNKPLNNNGVFYEVGTAGTCTNCPQGTICDTSTNLCVSTSATTSAPTIAPSPDAEFPPQGSTGICSSNRMNDALRESYVKLHNARRSLLAQGKVARKDGKLLPTAANMLNVNYNCTLENEATWWASQCPTTPSPLSIRPQQGENFVRFSASGLSDFTPAVEQSINKWWDVIRQANFGVAVLFNSRHDGNPICSFTQMGWATSNEVGCSIVKCKSTNEYVAVCRYQQRGNILNEYVYKTGTLCSGCPVGAACLDGLCTQ